MPLWCAVFEPLDILSPDPVLYFKSKNRYITTSGTVGSFVIYLVFLALILYFFIDFLLGSGMTIIYSKEEVSEDFHFDLNKKLLAFDFRNLNFQKISPKVASIFPVLWRYTGANHEIVELPIEPCEYDKHFSKSKYEFAFEQLNVSDFQCLVTDGIDLSLFFNKSVWSGSFIILYLRTCTNSTSNNNFCYPQEEIDDIMNGESYYFSFMLETTKVNHYNRTSPYEVTSYYQQVKIGLESRIDLNVYYSPINYNTDKGWLFESIRTENTFKVDQYLTTQVAVAANQHYYYPNTFSKFQLGLNYSTKEKYKRAYPKIQSVIANITGLINLSFQIGKFIISLFTSGQYFSKFFEDNHNINLTTNNTFYDTPKTGSTRVTKANSEKKEISSIHNKMAISCKLTQRNKKYIRISPCMSFKWNLFPKCYKKLQLISKFERTVKMTLSVDNLFRKLQEKTAGKLTNNPTIEEKNIINSTMRNRSVYSRDGYNRSLSSVNLNSVFQNDYISKKLSYVNNYV